MMETEILGRFQEYICLAAHSISLAILFTCMIIAVFLYFIIKYLVIPLDWTKEFDGSGYNFVQGTGYKRLNRVKDLRRLRNVGDLPPVYPNGWFMLAESREVRKVPHYVAALGENFALFRGTDGVCHVVDAYCPHLGANMAIGGRVVGDCIECPFHKWQFSGIDGKCTSVPYSEKVPKFAEVKSWRSIELNETIFVWYHAEGEEPSWEPEEIPNITSGNLMYRGRNEYKVNAHIQEIPENGSDLSHFNVLHKTNVLLGSDIAVNHATKWKLIEHSWEAEWEPSVHHQTKHIGLSKIRHHIQILGMEVVNHEISVRQYGPGYVVLRFDTPVGQLIILQTVTPIEPLMQKLVHRAYATWALAPFGGLMIMGESIMVERDIMVWNHKKYLDKPLLVKEDKAISRYRRWFAQFYSDNSPTYSQKKKSLDW